MEASVDFKEVKTEVILYYSSQLLADVSNKFLIANIILIVTFVISWVMFFVLWSMIHKLQRITNTMITKIAVPKPNETLTTTIA